MISAINGIKSSWLHVIYNVHVGSLSSKVDEDLQVFQFESRASLFLFFYLLQTTTSLYFSSVSF